MDQDNYGQSRQSSLSLASLVAGEEKFEKYAKAGLITSSIALGITVLMGILILILAVAGNWQSGGVLG